VSACHADSLLTVYGLHLYDWLFWMGAGHDCNDKSTSTARINKVMDEMTRAARKGQFCAKTTTATGGGREDESRNVKKSHSS
jgi:hypothetical protein